MSVRALPTSHDDVRISQGEAPLTAGCEALQRKYELSISFLFVVTFIVSVNLSNVMAGWLDQCHLVESKVATIGTKFVS